MKVVYSPTALKKISRLPKKERIKVVRNTRKIASSPHAGKKLKGGLKKLRSSRVWPYRIIYRISGKIIIIITVEHRQNVYK